jgi:oxaloacetate decarboxylase alpha subunit
MHFHNRTAMASLNHIIGVEEGLTIVHTAVSPVANGPSMPSTEVTADNVRRLGHEIAIDTSRISEVAEHFGALADELGYERGRPVEYAVANLQQQFPGGMMGTLQAQLRTYGMDDRLPAVLEEAVRVRAEMGYPIMATPFSQLVGIQALLNVVQGERYLTIPDENLMYLAGHYGTPPGPLDPDVLDRAVSTERGKRMFDREPPQPTLAEIRRQLGRRLPDEELLLRYLIPEPDVDAMYAAAKPIEPVFPATRSDLGWLEDVIGRSGPKSLTATDANVTIELRR